MQRNVLVKAGKF